MQKTKAEFLVNKDRRRHQNDSQWRTAFESSDIGITMANFAGRFFMVNSAFQKMLGYTESELFQLTFMDLTYEQDRRTHLELIRELVEGKRHHFRIEKRYCRKDGTLVWGCANVALVPGMDDVAPFWFTIVEDITGRKQAQQELRTAQAELERIFRLTTMGELAASIAHEVNQPLTAVVNNSNACLRLLADRNLKPEVLHQALEEIVADATRAAAVIIRIRALIMKTPSGKNELDINDVIHEMLALTGRELAEDQILLEGQLTKQLPPVLGDRVQLQQVLLNLIVNGIEAMATVTNRPKVLRVQSKLDESGNVLVSVSDSGTGLGRKADRIFTPLFTTKVNGTGMGLCISRSVVERHGGHLWAAPDSPHGAVFYFTLPPSTGSTL
jgi:PAS domain S-box-containing protein